MTGPHPWTLQGRIAAWMNGTGSRGPGRRSMPYRALVRELAVDRGMPDDSTLAQVYERSLGALPIQEVKEARALLHPAQGWEADPFLRPLLDLRDYVRKNFSADEISGFYVHGSLATMDYVPGYSDMDALVIVKEQVLEDPAWAQDLRSRLLRCNAYQYLLDPLQHHPLFILTELDLSHHFQPLFPTILFDRAAELTCFDKTHAFHCHDPSRLFEEMFETFSSYLTQPEKYGMMGRNPYQVKQYVQCILLMPTIYLQLLTGACVHKGDSFERCRDLIPPAAWKVVERAGMVRSSCPFRSFYPAFLRRWAAGWIPYRLLHRLHRDLDRNVAPRMKRILGPDPAEGAALLVRAMRVSLDQEGRYGLERGPETAA